MGVKERNLKRLNGDPLRSGDRMRDGEGIRCGFVFGSSRSMGGGQPPLSYNPPQDVPTCHLRRTERGRMVHLLRHLVANAPAEPRGRYIHCSAGTTQNQPGGTPRYLLGGLQAAQVTQLPTRRTSHFEGGISYPPLPLNGGRRQS